jgi:hypothetical protein
VHRFRSLIIALVVLGLSAGAVFASKSISDAVNASNSGHVRAQAVSGLTLPASGSAAQDGLAVSHDRTTGSDSTAGTDDPERDASSGTDASAGTDASSGTGKPTDNHGAVVSAAAHLSFEELQTACAGFDGKNKGAFISAIARGLLDVTVSSEASGGTTSVTCSVPDSSGGTTAPVVHGAPNTASPSPATPPTKLHGRDNAAAQQAAHGPSTRGRPAH